MLHPPVRRRAAAARPLGAGPRGRTPGLVRGAARGALPGWALHRRPHGPAGIGSPRDCCGTSVDVCRCRKTSLFSALFGKFGELPKPSGLGEQKRGCREAAGAAVPGDSAGRCGGRSAGGGDRSGRAVGLPGPTCCTGGVRRSEPSQSCP